MNSHSKVSGQHKKALSIINDLIRVNIDRITAYEKAAHEDKQMNVSAELRDVFYRMAVESRSYVNDLHAHVIRLGGAPVTQSTISGKLYLHWLNGKANFEGQTPDALLEDCLKGEESAQRIYQHALEEALPENVHQLVESQLWGLERAHKRLTAIS